MKKMFLSFGLIIIAVQLLSFLFIDLVKGSYWIVELLALSAIGAIYIGFYAKLKELQAQQMKDIESTVVEKYRTSLEELLRGIKNIGAYTEQLAVVYRDSIATVERISNRLKSFTEEPFRSLNGQLDSALQQLRQNAETLIPTSISLKTSFQKLMENMNLQYLIEEFNVIGQSIEQDTTEGSSNIEILQEQINEFTSKILRLDTHTKHITMQLKEEFRSVKETLTGDVEEIKQHLTNVESLMEEHIDSLISLKDIENVLGQLIVSLQRITSSARLLSINAQVSAVQHTQQQSFMVVAEEILELSEAASEATRQINKTLHEAFARIEATIDNAKDILSSLKTIRESVNYMEDRIVSLDRILKQLQRIQETIIENCTGQNFTLSKILEITEQIRGKFDSILRDLKVDKDKLESFGNELMKVIAEDSLFKRELIQSEQKIQLCAEVATKIMQDVELLRKGFDKVKTQQNERYNTTATIIEESIVTLQQIKLIEEHLRALQTETRNLQRVAERILK